SCDENSNRRAGSRADHLLDLEIAERKVCGGRALNQTKRVDSWSVDDAINFQALVLLEGADRSPRRRAERAGDCTAVVTEFLKSALNIHDHLVGKQISVGEDRAVVIVGLVIRIVTPRRKPVASV